MPNAAEEMRWCINFGSYNLTIKHIFYCKACRVKDAAGRLEGVNQVMGTNSAEDLILRLIIDVEMGCRAHGPDRSAALV
jgi:hypothetical protein